MRILILSVLLCQITHLNGQDTFSEKADRFFKKYMVNNRINYQRLVESPGELDSLTEEIASTIEANLNQHEFLSFYINAYNLLVIKGVVDQYPFENLEEIPGFFKETEYVVANQKLSLDEVEFQKLFRENRDPRFHFVLNCGALSCPTLSNEAMKPAELDQQLDFAIRLVMDRDDYVYVNHAEKSVWVSRIFDWYNDDFTAEGSLREFINKHRFTSIPANYEIKYLDYDWRLNDANASE